MYPNQPYPGQGGGANPPYPQQSLYNVGGVQRPQQPNASSNIGAGFIG